MNDTKTYPDGTIESKPISFSTPREPEGPSNLVAGLLRRWYILVAVCFVMCGAGLPVIWLLIEPLYSATAAIRVAPIMPNILTGESDGFNRSDYQSFMYTEAEMVKSSQVVQRVADELAKRDLEFFKNEPSNLFVKLRQIISKSYETNPEPAQILKQAIANGVIEAAADRRLELIKVTAKSTEPAEARQIANAFVSAYMAIEGNRSLQDENQNLQTLESERDDLARKLKDQRSVIRGLAQEYGNTDLTSRQDMSLQRVTSLMSELTRIEARRISLEAQVQYLEHGTQPAVEPAQAVQRRSEYINSNPMIQQLTSSIVELERELIEAKQTLGHEHWTLKQKQDLLDAFRARIEEKRQELGKSFDDMISIEASKNSNEKLLAAKAELDQTKAHEKRLRDILENEDTQTIRLGRTQLNIQDEQFQLQLNQQMYDQLSRRIQELDMELKRPARVSVAYQADISYIRDKRIKYSIALVFLAFAGGSGLAFVRDRSDKSLWTPDDVTNQLGIRIIGTTASSQTLKPSVFAAQIAGDYQAIRANLGLSDTAGIPNIIVIASPGTREGKTTFAINLATSMSKAGKRVLLIDGDLRKPDIAYLLNLPKNSTGLEDVLLGKDLDQVVCTMVSTGLHVLSSRSHHYVDPYELIASPLAAQQISKLTEKYDQIIIDTPPVLAFPDALVWAKIGGAVVLVSFAGHTTSLDLKQAKERFEQIDARVLGTVLGNVAPDHSYYRYGYAYYTRDGQHKTEAKRIKTRLLMPVQDQEGNSQDSQ
jgi:succinoglycan biosynthesis transport protein ExoP